MIGEEYLYFYDAISPVVEADSINMDIVFRASRYDRGGDDYVNCPLRREDYYSLVEEIVNSQFISHNSSGGLPYATNTQIIV